MTATVRSCASCGSSEKAGAGDQWSVASKGKVLVFLATGIAMSDFLLAMLLAFAVLVVAFPVLRWATRAEKQAEDRIVMGRVYYPTRGRKTDMPPFRRRRAASGRSGNDELVDLDGDERNDRT